MTEPAPAAAPAAPATAPTTASTSPLIHLVDPVPASKPAPAAAPMAAPQADWALKPQERFEKQQQQVDALYNQIRPGLKPGEKISAADYEKLSYAERVRYAEQFEWQPGDRQQAPADPNAPLTTDPNAERIKIGDVDATEAEWRDALAFKAAEDAKRLLLPPTPADYKLELPAEFKLPSGVEFKFNENDPVKGDALRHAREFAKANNLSQEQFSGMLALYAGAQAREQMMINSAAKSEIDKLGAAGSSRVSAVATWLKSEVGDELATPLLQTLVSEKQVRAYEKMIDKKTSQGAAGFSQAHRDVSDRNRVDQATYDRMSYTEKKDYAARFSQRG